MAMNERFYREELDYLRQYGLLLAQENPALKSFLGSKNADPNVEHLLEGFAFLAGRLREKFEDEFPEITVPLINRQWPNYLRPVPPMTVIEYTPDSRRLTAPLTVSRGEQVMNPGQDSQPENSRPGDESGATGGPPSCIFTLCRDIRLLPLCIETIQSRSSPQSSTLDLIFTVTGKGRIAAADLNQISFWLGDADELSRSQLYLWLCRHRIGAELIAAGQHYPQPDLALSPAGFSASESLLPSPAGMWDGYRILQDWLCFPDVLYFFNLRDVVVPDGVLTGSFTLRLNFNRPLPEELHISRDSLRLHCAPAVNLFVHDSIPFVPDSTRREYPLLVSEDYPDHYDIFSVRGIRNRDNGPERTDGLRNMMLSREQNVLSLDNDQPRPEYHREKKAIYWRHRTKTALLRETPDHFISLVHFDGSTPDASLMSSEPVLVSLVCTSGDRPCLLAPGDICEAAGQNTSVASFRNVTTPTRPVPPVPDGSLHWSLLNIMTLNWLTMNDVEALRDILRALDRHGIHMPLTARLSPEKLNGLEKLETLPTDRLFRGVMIRGLSSTLYVNPQPFSCEGEMYLLGTVLSHFFALYASTNSWHMLTMINTETKETWRWKERTGQFPLM
ncbi:TPA: type VI secretion system baseplate subunit TssF [Escherichia coli]|nr:type VI secretion system baseplate subunit TssF [Escherichia coli]